MNTNGGIEPLTVGSYVPINYQFPMTVDTSHSPTAIQNVKPLNSNGSSTSKYQFHQRSTIKWNEAGISISAKRQLPFVHRFRGLPPPAGPPPPPEVSPNVSTITKKATHYQANPVGALQERFQAQGVYPTYQFIQADGASHCPTFVYQVNISDLKATGGGASKKKAKQNAARAMLDKLDSLESGIHAPELTTVSQGLVLAIANQPLVDYVTAMPPQPPGEMSGSNPVGLLQEFCVKNGLPVAVYETQLVAGLPHERSFELACKVGMQSITGTGPSKKEAKRRAASDMLEKLRNTTSVQSLQDMVIDKTQERKNSHQSSSSVVELFKSQLDSQRPKFQTLLSTSHWSPTDEVCSILSDLCLEQDLELSYTYLGKFDEANNVLCIAQVSSLIYPGVGRDEPHAREDAARNVLRTLQGLAHIKQSSNLDARVPNGKIEEAIPNPDPRNCFANEILKHK